MHVFIFLWRLINYMYISISFSARKSYKLEAQSSVKFARSMEISSSFSVTRVISEKQRVGRIDCVTVLDPTTIA